MAVDYSKETWDSPSNAQLASWGITRAQYKSLYSKAEKEVAKESARWYLPKALEYSVGDVNRYLKDKMVETNGSYGLSALGLDKPATQTTNTTTKKTPVVETPTVSTGGSGGGSTIVKAVEPTYYTGDDLAKRFGIVNDYATILKELQDATNAQFDETETTMKRAESSNLRSQETAYNQYLQDLRSRSANAVASGATKGTMAANALASLMTSQETNREGINTLNDLLYDTAQQRGTMLKADATTARTTANEIGQYLGNLAASNDTNMINKYAAELAANAQTRAASIGASATTNAAKTAANSTYQQILNAFTNDYVNKGYNTKAANALAYTDYANLIKKQYSTTN